MTISPKKPRTRRTRPMVPVIVETNEETQIRARGVLYRLRIRIPDRLDRYREWIRQLIVFFGMPFDGNIREVWENASYLLAKDELNRNDPVFLTLVNECGDYLRSRCIFQLQFILFLNRYQLTPIPFHFNDTEDDKVIVGTYR